MVRKTKTKEKKKVEVLKVSIESRRDSNSENRLRRVVELLLNAKKSDSNIENENDQ